MKPFISDNFLLGSQTSRRLYHETAQGMPIIDYHNHLPPEAIAEDRNFENLTRLWLSGDHYKWRAMRTMGVDEKYCSGQADDYEKFIIWAQTVPHTLRNPLHHWTHMELKKPFGITSLLNPDTADRIFHSCNEMLQSKEFSCRNLLRLWRVEALCTTDDPVDDLSFHRDIRSDGFEIGVFPTWRPDRALAVEDAESYNRYLHLLEAASDTTIRNGRDLLDALFKRITAFHEMGCRLSDHGISHFYTDWVDAYTFETIFSKLRSNRSLTDIEVLQFKSNLLSQLAEEYHRLGWVQQLHVGALRNNNSTMFQQLGPDSGFDSIGDREIAADMSRFFDRLRKNNRLAKSIVYNINPKDNGVIASMIGNFPESGIPGKMQWGAAWWFLDQREGIVNHLNTLSNLGLLNRFVGMLTDSRSFLSFSRHEYFRRILCDVIGGDCEKGLLPDDINLLKNLITDISYNNAKNYFLFPR